MDYLILHLLCAMFSVLLYSVTIQTGPPDQSVVHKDLRYVLGFGLLFGPLILVLIVGIILFSRE